MIDENVDRIKRVYNFLWDNRIVIIPCVVAFFVFGIIYALMQPNYYTSTATILPSGAAGGNFGAMYGLFPELTENLTSGSISSFLFPDILKSRIVVLAVVDAPFDSTLKNKIGANNLRELYGISNDDKVIKMFLTDGLVRYSFDKGIIKLSFKATDPYLAYYVTKTWLDKLKWFVENHMTTEAKRNYEYLKDRVETARELLKISQDSLASFIKTHRNYQSDPIQNMKYASLSVSVSTKQAIYQSLVQQLEQARVEMVKSIPTVKVLDEPYIPEGKSGPKRSMLVVGITLLGLAVGLVAAGLRQFWLSWTSKK